MRDETLDNRRDLAADLKLPIWVYQNCCHRLCIVGVDSYADDYVSQPFTGMDEDDENKDEFTYIYHPLFEENVNIPFLQLQFLTGTYNQADSYVSQPFTGMDEDDENKDEFTYIYHPL
ncbi:hypothetical protein Scep_004165 [Stephania cephalantha]|uniref:Uncharacterized protein n=1 Tax=Stephania cephalantha TaxID=152367 RepID=A0AAP0KS19_9MAGN